MKKIAVDAMGGDNAPQALVEGVNRAVQEFSDIEILLYGDEAKIKPYLTAGERVRIIHTEEKIDSDDEPTKAIRQKKEASMVLAAKAVKAGEADAMLSAGNTGALLAAGFFIVGRIKNNLKETQNITYFTPREIVEVSDTLRDDVLTIGFARRFATYKRAHLLFTNLDRLDAIVNNPDRPVQFIFAGKAHPADKAGQDLIKHIVEISKQPRFLGKIIFLSNYDMDLARALIQGVDVWMNTPTRPLEASGTSGEKAAMNGVMHFSVLDGWWVEGYREDAGWMLPQKRTYENQQYQDELDAELIYNIIEDQIAPAYYNKDSNGISIQWCNFIKNTIGKVAPQFTTYRMPSYA